MHTLNPEQLYIYHNQLTVVMICFWSVIVFLGYKIRSQKTKRYISYAIIIFAVLQEIVDYSNRLFFDKDYTISWAIDLPLQFCHFGLYFSLIGVFLAIRDKKINPKVEQFLFDCAYVLGFGGSLQALIAGDLTGVYNIIGAYTLNWQHSLIILNVLWLIFAYKKRFYIRSILNAFLFINLIIFPIGLINYLLNANYMFVCRPPNVDSMFFIGQWPYYLLWLELIYLVYSIILYLPFKAYDIFKR